MSRNAYYEELKRLAREKRAKYQVDTAAFGLRELRRIYKAEGIRIDHWPLSRKIKALYMCADDDCSVALQKSLPDEPKLFALVHELKHHYRDRESLGSGVLRCGDYDANELVEKGAEVFAAEFIYPESEFEDDMKAFGRKIATPADIVDFKRSCRAKISYRFICKRLERMGLIGAGQFDCIQFQKLEEQIYGMPFYKRFRRRKAGRG
jgi:Zn-dependent peptidase ImmA (M78 family)